MAFVPQSAPIIATTATTATPAHYTLSLFATLNRFVKSSLSLHHSDPALSWEASLNFATGHGRYERAAHKKGHKSHDKNGRGLIFTNCRIVVTSDQP